MGIIKETLKEAFEDTKLELGVAKPDWLVSYLPKIGLAIWWAVVVIWFVSVQFMIPIKLFMYGKMNNSLAHIFGAVFIILIGFIINTFLLNFTMKLHDKIMEKK
jgi:hypothetical protein